MNNTLKYKREHLRFSYLVDKKRVIFLFLLSLFSFILLLEFLLYLLKSKDFTDYVGILFIFVIILSYGILYFILDYNMYRDKIKNDYAYEIINDFEKFISDNNGEISRLYVSRELYNMSIHSYILMFHNVEFVIDPYRFGYSYGMHLKSEIIETIEDIL
jgi:hypothetical protein